MNNLCDDIPYPIYGSRDVAARTFVEGHDLTKFGSNHVHLQF